METEVLVLGANDPSPVHIRRAATVLMRGGLVAFPTETVYGLGARATDECAVQRIFEAKARPSTSPLILHVAGISQARGCALRFPREAQLLAEAFWPGPLSIVVHRATDLPSGVVAGGTTVALRAPKHAVALALIDALGEPLAASSANRSQQLPPVRARHVLQGLAGRVEVVLDAGICPGGIESTVVDVTRLPARVVRRGAVDVETIRSVVNVEECVSDKPEGQRANRGWLRLAPRRRLWRDLRKWVSARRELAGAVVRGEREGDPSDLVGAEIRRLPETPESFAASMYGTLHDLQDAGCGVVWVEQCPDGGSWAAIGDRLTRLSAEIAER